VSARTPTSSHRDASGLRSITEFFGIDFHPRHNQPLAFVVVVATVVALAGSLLCDVAVVALATHVYASTRGYVHFRFEDYAKLTTIGVVIACAAWPLVTRISSTPRRPFFVAAIAVTGMLLLPDLYLLAKGQPPRAVFFLMLMHVAIGLVTYNALVRIARADPLGKRSR
jgi:hypothetical protein